MITDQYSVGILCATECVLLILTVYLWSKSTWENLRFVPFRRFVTLSAFACLIEIVYSALANIHYSMPGIFYQSLYELDIFMGMMATCSLYLYFVQFLAVPKIERRLFTVIRYAVIAAEGVMLLANYATGHVVRYNSDGYYVPGPLYETASYILPFYFIIAIAVLAVLHFKQFNKKVIFAFGIVTAVAVLFYPVQVIYFSDVLTEYFIVGLFAVVMFFVLETSPVNLLLETERQMEDATKKIDEATRAAMKAAHTKSDFLSNMSHEIRTPMNAIIGMNDMILRETKSPETRMYAEEIRSSGKHLLHVINDILDYSRMESGKTGIRIGTYRLSSLLNRLFDAAKEGAQEKGLSFSIDADRTLPDTLIGDEDHLFQAVFNLIENAIKYTEHGSVKLTVNGVRRDMALTLFFKVTDTGIGIGKDSLQKIFDSFSRANIERNRNILGTGLGLAITKGLVGMMDGDITVRSAEGAGSTFIIRISQQILSDAAGAFVTDDLLHTSTEETDEEPADYHGARVLVVDDNSVNLRITSMLLKPYGIDARLAPSGKACLAACTEQSFDLIFLDHQMPDMDGEETLHALRASDTFHPDKTRVVALTALDDSDARERFIRMGFDDYLTKPMEPGQLGRVLSATLKGGRDHDV
ncbi:MAG: response regulator [Lachnospiraceae bacterium]|nr:response regulator [Lachnospiraceae bacterium]